MCQFVHAEKYYSVEVKRGQCILKISKIAKELKIDHKRVRRSIEILSKWYSQLESKAMPFGLIVTVKNYDKLVKMENGMESERKVKGKSKESERRANKSYKRYKSIKRKRYVHPKTFGLKEKDFREIAQRRDCPLAFVRSKYEDMILWHEENPLKNRRLDWRATLRVWVKKDFLKIKQRRHRGPIKFAIVEGAE